MDGTHLATSGQNAETYRTLQTTLCFVRRIFYALWLYFQVCEIRAEREDAQPNESQTSEETLHLIQNSTLSEQEFISSFHSL